MISQLDLRLAMGASDRPVSSRLVSSWVTKQLLPPMKDRGRGLGKGKQYYWTDPDLLEQAKFVYDAYALNAKRESIFLALAVAGYDVTPAEYKRAWNKHLSRLELDKSLAPEAGEDPNDPFREMATRLSASVTIPGLTPDDIDIALFAGLKIIFAPRDFRPRDETLAAFIVAGTHWMNHVWKDKSLPGEPFAVTERFIQRATRLVGNAFSSIETRELLKGMDIAQMKEVLVSYRTIINLILALLAREMSAKDPEWQLTLRKLICATIGPAVLRLILRLVAEGNAKRIGRTRRSVEFALQKLTARSTISEPESDTGSTEERYAIARVLFAEIADIWRGYDLFRLYNVP